MDEYDYLTEDELNKISSCILIDNPKQFIDLMDYIKSKWRYADCGYWKEKGDKYCISTAGWSGNEDIVYALKLNVMFWSLCWVQSRRGGHYIFQKPCVRY